MHELNKFVIIKSGLIVFLGLMNRCRGARRNFRSWRRRTRGRTTTLCRRPPWRWPRPPRRRRRCSSRGRSRLRCQPNWVFRTRRAWPPSRRQRRSPPWCSTSPGALAHSSSGVSPCRRHNTTTELNSQGCRRRGRRWHTWWARRRQR